MNEFGDCVIWRLSHCEHFPQLPDHQITKSPNRAISRSPNGVTLLEMLIVVALIGLLAGISFPSVSAGLDAIRLASAGDQIAGFLNGALNRADRRQEAIEITIDPSRNALLARSARPGFERRLDLPDGVRIAAIFPPAANQDDPRHFLVYPGGTAPRVRLEIVNRKGGRRSIEIDPITGVPQIQRPAPK